MSKNKNHSISLIGEGYDDSITKRIQEEKEKIKKQQEDSMKIADLNFLTRKNLIIFILWGLIYKIFINYEFGLVYLMLTIIVLIFTNLGKREAWQLSAYSVFNPNFERLPGTFTVNDIAAGMGMSSISRNNEEEETQTNQDEIIDSNRIPNNNNNVNQKLSMHDLRKKQLKEKAKMPLKTPCPCGSNKKYKNCCLLKED